MRLVFRIRDVDLKDDFRSVDESRDVVAQPRSDFSEEEDADDYDDDEDVENENVENSGFRRTEKASPVLSNNGQQLQSFKGNFALFVFVIFVLQCWSW